MRSWGWAGIRHRLPDPSAEDTGTAGSDGEAHGTTRCVAPCLAMSPPCGRMRLRPVGGKSLRSIDRPSLPRAAPVRLFRPDSRRAECGECEAANRTIGARANHAIRKG
jgi:hypothetical protein